MTREEAINVVRNIYQTDKEKEALSILIPEFTESEDEKVRQALLRCCDDWDKGQFGCMEKEDIPSIRAYLERMKEHQPTEWGEEDKKRIVELKTFIAQCKGFNKENQEKVFDMIDALRPQQKQEWSEEDKTRLKVITEELERFIMIHNYGTPLSVDDLDWLKSLPERFNLQSKHEWSEEDEKIWKEIVSFLKEDTPYFCSNTIRRQKWATWLEKQKEQWEYNYNKGRLDALKDLPRWRKWENGACGNGRGIPMAIVKRGLNGYELVDSLGIQGEQYIMLSDLEKLNLM